MTIHFAMSASQKADLLQLLRQQQTRHSSQFHQWLTPEQYADRFGMNSKDIEKVTLWLESAGFSNVQAARGRTFITFSGTAAQAQNAFHTTIHNYTQNGVSHYANATEPEFPKALNGMVESIRGLQDFKPKPHLRSHLTSSATGNHFLVPDDWATIYDLKPLYSGGYNGSGRSIVVVGQTDVILSDIETFQIAIGQPVKDPQVILTGVDPGVQAASGDLGESDLDLEWTTGIAPGASVIFVTSTDVLTSESYAVDNNVADVLSITYGECEADTGATEMASLNSLFQQASAQGMSVVAAAGDQGAADCDDPSASYASQGLAVDVPGSSPYVTSMGGTEFTEGSTSGGTQYWSATDDSSSGSALSYIPETAWNDTATDGTLTATGGGASKLNSKPSWQTGTGVPNDGARDVPDLAVTASADHDGYLTCSNGSCVVGLRGANPVGGCAAEGYTTPCGTYTVSGGTSAATPSFAGFVAILDQKVGGRQGLLNPNIYTLASVSSTGFHDITTGNNIVPCRGGTPNCSSTLATVTGTLGYSAGAGYDQASGWGSIDANVLAGQWNDDFGVSSNPTSLTVSPGSSGTATITVTPVGAFAGAVTFSCALSSSITNTTCSVPGTVNGSGTVTLTVTASSSAKNMPWWRPNVPVSGPTDRGLLFGLAGLLLALGVYLVTKQRKMQMVGIAFSVLLVVGLCSCGGSSSTSTSTLSGSGSTTTTSSAETGTVTVTATSGSLVNNITIALTIT
jgi:subtilase family serine protease